MSWIDSFTAVGAKIGNQKHLGAVKDGFISLMPLIMAGSAALIIKNIPIPGWQNFLPEFIINLCNFVWWGTFGFLAIFAVFSIAYHLARAYNGDPFRTGFIALASYLAIIPQTAIVNGEPAWGFINWGYTSTNSLFVAIIVPLVAGELFIRFNKNKRLLITLPESVPPAVGKSFSVLIPAMLTISIVALIGLFLEMLTGQDLFDFINSLFAPLISATDSMWSGIVLIFLNQFFWMLGLHGPSIIGGVLEPISLNLMTENMAAFAAGLQPPHIMTKPFLDTFVHLGGSGATLGLLFAIFIVSKSKLFRTLGKTCIGPGAFEINEPVIFGMPIVLNPILALPFILGPILLVIISYIATDIGLVNRTVAIIPWATPPFLSGLAATGGDWRAVVLQAINLTIATVIYLPFIKIADRLEQQKELEG
ncbi:MAG: PTS sugar transporter subunit IIC [Elusimicrobiota bacterium]|jgi:PTS system cellobiose-specific IIC component|nr:PTS sugar transporter subunit IIC [Elusimicrobiota bacterium]